MHQLSKALVVSFITVAELLLSARIVCINYESNAHAALIEGSTHFNFHTLIFGTPTHANIFSSTAQFITT